MQGLESQSFFQTFMLFAAFIQVFRIFQEQPAGAFEALHLHPVRFVIELPPEFKEFVVEELDNVKVIKD